MQKTVLITGSTDGIGLETAKVIYAHGHRVLLHGRNTEKLAAVESTLADLPMIGEQQGAYQSFVADLSVLKDVEQLAQSIAADYASLDVVINNAGVYRVAQTQTEQGIDMRFMVNTIAPFVLTQRLMPLLSATSRVVNLSSAAQASVNVQALLGNARLDESMAYAQSKLALTMWSRQLGLQHKNTGPVIVSVNPKSLLGSKMVKDAYGITGGDLRLGADILVKAALSDEFAQAHGDYFDNDAECFAAPHRDALIPEKCRAVVDTIEQLAARLA